MTFSDSVMQSSKTCRVRCVDWTLVLDEELDQRGRTDCRGSVQGILPTLVADPDGCGRLLVEQLAGELEIILGRHKMHYCLDSGIVVSKGD